jgi:hypothetical protein
MKLKIACLVCLLTCVAVSLIAQNSNPLSGTWTGDWGPTPTHRNSVVVELKWDGKTLTGTVNPGPNAVMLQKASFDSKTGAVHFEADSAGMGGGPKVHFIIDGKLENGTMVGSWNHDTRKGDFKIAKK